MGAIDRVRRWPVVDLGWSVQARTTELGGGFMASAVTLALFISLFPMLLVAIAVLGFLSAGDSSLAADLVGDLGLTGESATVVTDAVAAAERGRGAASIVGFAGLVWASLGVVGAVEHVCDRAWQAPGRGLLGKVVGVAWLLGALVMLGASTALAGLLAVLPGWLAPVQVIGGVGLLIGFFLFTFRTLTSKPLPLSAHLPGAVMGGVGFHLLTIVAALVVPRQAASSSALYGSIGVVFAVLAWLLVFGRLLVYSIVLNVELYERRQATDPHPAP